MSKSDDGVHKANHERPHEVWQLSTATQLGVERTVHMTIHGHDTLVFTAQQKIIDRQKNFEKAYS